MESTKSSMDHLSSSLDIQREQLIASALANESIQRALKVFDQARQIVPPPQVSPTTRLRYTTTTLPLTA